MKTTSKVVKIKPLLFPSNVNNSCFNLGAIMFVKPSVSFQLALQTFGVQICQIQADFLLIMTW